MLPKTTLFRAVSVSLLAKTCAVQVAVGSINDARRLKHARVWNSQI